MFGSYHFEKGCAMLYCVVHVRAEGLEHVRIQRGGQSTGGRRAVAHEELGDGQQWLEVELESPLLHIIAKHCISFNTVSIISIISHKVMRVNNDSMTIFLWKGALGNWNNLIKRKCGRKS